MRIFDLLGMCVKNLTRRKFRTFLTVMGVVIGTCSIIVMISLGVGISKSQDEFISSFGDLTIITVYGGGGENKLDDAAIAGMLAIKGVDVATPFAYFYDIPVKLLAGNKGRYALEGPSLCGVYPEALEKMGYTVSKGRMLTGNGGKKIELLFGEQVAYQFMDTKKKWPNNQVNPYPDENGVIKPPFVEPMEEAITISLASPDGKKDPLVFEVEVTGVMQGGGSRSYETMGNIFVDVKDIKRIRAEYDKAFNIKRDKRYSDSYDSVRVKVGNINDVADIQKEIEGMGYGTWSMESWRQQAQESSRQIQLILGGLGAVSLFVSAISITNTMIMSVYERTREIGVMKVLGCLVGNIRTIFLVEAGMIGFLGGVVGVVTSYLLSFIMNTFAGKLGQVLGMMPSVGGESKLSIIPLWLVLLGMGFATFIGIVSGFYPANRAVKISALEAIKQE